MALDGSEWFECQCQCEEHTVKFTLCGPSTFGDEDDMPELYLSVFLIPRYYFHQRLWVALKYLFGFKCKFGHFDNWTLNPEDGNRLIKFTQRYIKVWNDWVKNKTGMGK